MIRSLYGNADQIEISITYNNITIMKSRERKQARKKPLRKTKRRDKDKREREREMIRTFTGSIVFCIFIFCR